jgi:uncharacterized protein
MPPHGITTNVLTIGTRPIAPVATAIIGLLATATAAVGPATAALDAAFPLDTPVLVTDIRKAIGEAGTGGTLKPALEAIADQASPVVIVVRIGIGVDQAEQDDFAIGDTVNGNYTGLQALLAAEVQTGFRPRIIGAPALDTLVVTTAMVVVAQKLRAMVYAKAIGDDIADAVLYRDGFAARELMLLWPNFSGAFEGDAVARALGLRAAIDAAQGWHKTLSNVPVNGVTGLSKDIHFDIQDSSTDAGALNDGQITTLVRSNGFRFWGNRTASDEPLFAFESAVRTSQVLQDEIAEGVRWAIDKPMTAGLIRDMIDTINARFRSLKSEGRIIGASAWFDGALNSEVDLAAGKVTIDYDFTPAAPAENLVLNQRITDRYYGDIAAQLG